MSESRTDILEDIFTVCLISRFADARQCKNTWTGVELASFTPQGSGCASIKRREDTFPCIDWNRNSYCAFAVQVCVIVCGYLSSQAYNYLCCLDNWNSAEVNSLKIIGLHRWFSSNRGSNCNLQKFNGND